MAIIDDLAGSENEFNDIDALVDSMPEASIPPLPESATTNRSAVLAALSGDSQKIIDTYQGMQNEVLLGNTTLADGIQQQVIERNRVDAFNKGILPILYDPLADKAAKQKVLDDYREAVKTPDSLDILASEALIANSEGETADSEEARGSLAEDLFANFQQSRIQEQQIVNTFKLDLQQQATTLGQTGDIAQEFLVPVAEGIKTYKFISTLNEKLGKNTSFEKKVKSILRPGASMLDIRHMYEGLDDRSRIAFTQTLVDTIKETQGILFSTDSQFSAVGMLEKIIGDYSPAEASWDTISNALDIFGIGWAAKSATKAVRASRAAKQLAAESKVKAGANIPATASNPRVGPLDVPEDLRVKIKNPEKENIDKLYQEKADLIADSSGVLPNRTVSSLNDELPKVLEDIKTARASFKDEVKSLQIRKQMSRKEAESVIRKLQNDRLTDLEARKQRIESLLKQNAEGQKAQDRIKEIETEIERLSYLPDVDGVLRVNPLSDAINRIDRNSLVGLENPSSVGSIFFRTNPEKSRTALKLVFDSAGDEIAQALFGTSRLEALGNAIIPKQVTPSGTIAAKPVGVADKIDNPQRQLIDEIKDTLDEKDAVELTARERDAAASRVINDFKSPTKIRVVDGMDGFRVDHEGGKIKISSVYGSEKGSFSDAEDALEQAKLSLREYGDITPNATIMQKKGMNYEPVRLEDVKGVKGDFLVRIEFEKNLDRTDLPKGSLLDEFKVKWNWADSIPALISDRAGTLTRHLFTVGMIFDKHLTTAANVADALSSRLEKILQRNINQLVRNMKKLPEAQRNQLMSYFVEANEKGIAPNAADFAQRGFSNRMVQYAKDWRNYWDSVYYLENLDMIKTLRSQGYHLLDNGTDRFFARPISKNIREAEAYNPSTGKIELLNRVEMDKLYEGGGTLAELKSSFQLDGAEVTHLIVKNDSSSFLQGLRDTDKALKYRKGYYLTSYRAPIFIDKVDPKTGKRVAIATAKDRREADLYIKRKKQDDPDIQLVSRPDKKKVSDQKEDVWNLNHQGGRTAQRRRGQPLVEADGSNRLEGAAYFDTPIESAIRASRSIAGRAIYRDIIDTAKARAMQKYGHLFPHPEGVPKFPSKVSEISSEAGPFTKEVRDARSDFEYINYLENGYANGLDNMFKTFMGLIAQEVGELSIKAGGKTGRVLAGVERGANWTSDVAVSSLGKAFVFTAYIATSVLRQLVIQPAQLLRLAAYDPVGVPRAIGYVAEYTQFLSGGKTVTKEGKAFAAFVEDSGILDNVDKSNLVRGTLMTSGEQANWWTQTGGRATEAMRIIGYDIGEKTNLIGHMAAVYGKYVREGKAVQTKAIQHEMLGKARAISYDMSFSGDMPYNQNFMALFTQFLQVPHKALLQGFDRRLTGAERTRLVVGDTLIYGALGTTFVAASDALFGKEFLDENPVIRETLVNGALQEGGNAFLKHVITTAGGKDAFGRDLDLTGSLSPFEFGGYVKMAEAVLTDGGLMDALSNTPIGGLLLKNGNRMQKAVLSVGRLVGFLPDSELTPQTLAGTLNDIAKVTSGWNNIQKAVVASEINKILSNSGQTLLNGVSVTEAVALAFGIPPKEIAQFYESSMYIHETEKEYDDAVKQAARTAIQVAVGKTHVGIEDPRTLEIVNAILMKAYKSSPRAMEIINREMGFALRDPQIGLQNAAVKAMSLPELDLDRRKMKEMLPADKWPLYEQWQNDIANSLKQLDEEE